MKSFNFSTCCQGSAVHMPLRESKLVINQTQEFIFTYPTNQCKDRIGIQIGV